MASSTDAPFIPLVYRAFCLYIEPILALFGTYLCYFQQAYFVRGTTPLAVGGPNPVITPLSKLLLTEISGLYAYLAVNEALVLRLSKDPNVWKAVEFSLVLSDVAHLFAIYEASPAEFVNVSGYRSDDWINIGSLFVGLAIRLPIILGIGFKAAPKKAGGKQH